MSIKHAEELQKAIQNACKAETMVSDRKANGRHIRVWVDAGMRTGRVDVSGMGKAEGNLYKVDDVLKNPNHYLTKPAMDIKKAGGVAFIAVTLANKPAQVMIKADEWIASAHKINKQQADLAASHQKLNEEIIKWDDLYNEKSDGYNPYDPYR